jgi:hypothetical protein
MTIRNPTSMMRNLLVSRVRITTITAARPSGRHRARRRMKRPRRLERLHSSRKGWLLGSAPWSTRSEFARSSTDRLTPDPAGATGAIALCIVRHTAQISTPDCLCRENHTRRVLASLRGSAQSALLPNTSLTFAASDHSDVASQLPQIKSDLRSPERWKAIFRTDTHIPSKRDTDKRARQ